MSTFLPPTAIISRMSRKYASAACFWSRSFRACDFLFTLERWFFNIVCVFAFCAYAIWMIVTHYHELGCLLVLLYLCQLAFEMIQYVCLFWFSRSPARDLCLFPVVLFIPFYHTFLKLVDLLALTEEFCFRASGRDNFVPEKVRQATWRW